MNVQRRGLRWTHLMCVAVALATSAAALSNAQEPPPPPPPPATGSSSSASPTHASKKYSHKDDFVIRGTVFNEKALSFPGVELRIRFAGQKKYRWKTSTNSRGEFAVRVPQGSNYEMLVHAKGFGDQTRTVDAKKGDDEETVVFRMEPIAGGKK